MAENYFNDDQRLYMEYIFQVPRDKRCDCGWFRLGECSRSICVEVYAASKTQEAQPDAD